MTKHIWEWDKRSNEPMMVVCTRCGQRMPLSEVLDRGCNGCPVEGVQEELFGDQRENTRAREQDSPSMRGLPS